MTGLEKVEKECERTDEDFDANLYFALHDLVAIAKELNLIKEQIENKCECKKGDLMECSWCRINMRLGFLNLPFEPSTE